MVRISDTGQAELDTYRATKGSGYGPLDTGPAQKAVRTGFPVDAAYRPPVPATPAYGAAQGVMDAAARYNPSTWFEPEPVSGTYGLDFGYQSPITYEPSFRDVQTPWLEPDPWQTRPDNTGGFLGSLGRGAVDLGQQVWDIQQQRTNVSGGLGYAPYSSGGAGQVDPKQQSLEALEYQVSGNKWLEAAGFNPDALPYNLGYITDAINPIGIAAVGAGPSVPIIGSTLGGGLAKRAAGEIAIDVASRVGAEQAAGEFGESIPYFGELEPWQRGLIGGLAGGVTAGAGVKGLDSVDFSQTGTALRNVAEANPFAAPQPGAFDLPRGAIDPTTGRPFEWQAPMGGADELDIPKVPDAGLNQPTVDVPTSGNRALLDALDEELRIRRSGIAEAEISAGRGQQAAGIRAGIEGLAPEATLDDALSAARQGASTGPLRKTFAEPLNLTPEVQNQLVRDILDNPQLREFDTLRALKALDKLAQGEGLQPAEIKMLGRVFGPEVAAKISEVNAGRIPTVAQLTEADLAEIARRAEVDGRGVARLEVEAERQQELANSLRQQARMDPTNQRLQKAADDAQARAIAKANDADRKLAESIERANRQAEVRQTRAATLEEQRATRAESRAAEARDVKNPNYQQLIQRAEDALNKADISPELKAQQLESVRLWLKNNEVILDAYGDDAPGILRTLYSSVTGDVTDSWTSTLLTREAILRNALEGQGMSPNMAKLVARRLRDAEVERRFGQTIPAHIRESLDQAKGLPYGSEGSIGGLASISQELKNTQFGIGDLAVFGQQGLKAGTTNAPQLLAGMVNRMLAALHLPHVDTQLADVALAKRLMYQLDGVAQSSHAITDLTAEATLFSRLGKPGKWLDEKFIVPRTRQLTDFQFNTILTNIRNVAYEGNLILAKAAGADITDPVVRARAAEWANAATGAGKLAQKTGRAQAEKAFLLSPSMRRAQIQQLGQVARGLTSGSRVDRVLAAATIASAVGSTLMVGKLLNDWLGQGEFEFDPSKPGFGNVTLPGGTVINLFPQEQVGKALARSLRALIEDGVTEEDLQTIGKAWGNLGISSASPGVRPFLAALGVGYDPDTGYEYGGLGDGSSFAERLLKNAPIPPLGMSVATEGVDAVRTPLEALGVNAFQEGDYTARDRQLVSDPEFGKPYKELSPSEKRRAQEKYGATEPFGPEGVRAAEVTAQLTEQQKASDERLKAGELTPEQWKNDYNDRRNELRIRKDEIYAALDLKPGDNPVLDGYYAAIEDAERTDGTVDWDRVDSYVAGLSRKDKRYIRENTGLINLDTPQVREFEAARDRIEDAGWFERTDESWANVVYYYPELGEYKSYYDWRDAQKKPLIDAWVKEYGFSPEYAAREADKYLDEQQPATDYDFYAKMWREAWVEANPQAAFDAWKYGYYTPTDEYAAWLNQMYQGGYVK